MERSNNVDLGVRTTSASSIWKVIKWPIAVGIGLASLYATYRFLRLRNQSPNQNGANLYTSRQNVPQNQNNIADNRSQHYLVAFKKRFEHIKSNLELLKETYVKYVKRNILLELQTQVNDGEETFTLSIDSLYKFSQLTNMESALQLYDNLVHGKVFRRGAFDFAAELQSF